MTGCIAKSEHFFKVAILPELIGKFFSRPVTPASHVEVEFFPLQSSTDSTDHGASPEM